MAPVVRQLKSQTLNIRRKFLILIARTVLKTGYRFPIGSDEWIHGIFEMIRDYDHDIRITDVRRWTAAHSWIKDEEKMIPGMHGLWSIRRCKATRRGRKSSSYPKRSKDIHPNNQKTPEDTSVHDPSFPRSSTPSPNPILFSKPSLIPPGVSPIPKPANQMPELIPARPGPTAHTSSPTDFNEKNPERDENETPKKPDQPIVTTSPLIDGPPLTPASPQLNLTLPVPAQNQGTEEFKRKKVNGPSITNDPENKAPSTSKPGGMNPQIIADPYLVPRIMGPNTCNPNCYIPIHPYTLPGSPYYPYLPYILPPAINPTLINQHSHIQSTQQLHESMASPNNTNPRSEIQNVINGPGLPASSGETIYWEQIETLNKYKAIFETFSKLNLLCQSVHQLNELLPGLERIYRIIERNHKHMLVPFRHHDAMSRMQHRILTEPPPSDIAQRIKLKKEGLGRRNEENEDEENIQLQQMHINEDEEGENGEEVIDVITMEEESVLSENIIIVNDEILGNGCMDA